MHIRKLSFLLCLLLVMTVTFLNGQNTSFKFGLKGGIAKYDYGIREINIADPGSYKLNLEEEKFGFHGGVTLQLKVKKFFIQPEFLLNSAKVNYKLTDVSGNGLRDSIFSETYRDLDIPIMIGLKSGAFRVNAGPVAHIHLESLSEIGEVENYNAKFDELLWGYQAGIGLDIWKITIDVRYEGNFSKFGNHMYFWGKQYNFSNAPARLIASVGLQF